MTRKRHSSEEIAIKLHQADAMTEGGKRQGEIARALGVSIMTYHRWRKARPPRAESAPSSPVTGHVPAPAAELARIAELRLENDRLRRLVTDLLLEKIRLEEELQNRSVAPEKTR
jgi:transposase-like protein